MNKILTSATVAFAIAMTAATPAQADPVTIGNDNMTLEVGVEYLIPRYKECSGIYTAQATSRLFMDGASDFRPYADAEHTVDLQTTTLSPGGQERYIDVTQGEVLYFYCEFSMEASVFILYQSGINDKPLDILFMEPEEGRTVDLNRTPALEITFNQDIATAGVDASFRYTDRNTGNHAQAALVPEIDGAKLSVPFYDLLVELLTGGSILPGDEFNIFLTGLTTPGGTPLKGTTDGSVGYAFVASGIPVSCLSYYCPDPFLSYWPEGVKEGILVLEFSDDLLDDGETFVELGWGNMESENGEYYSEILPVTIEGARLTCNFTGLLRTPETMIPQYPDSKYPTISVKVNNVRDTSGTPVAAAAGNTGSFSFTPAYKVVERAVVAADFQPAADMPLENITSINVYLTGIDGISFDGFRLEGTLADASNKVSIVPMDRVTVEDYGGDAIYDFPIPEIFQRAAKDMTVTLNNLVSLDGYDHSGDVSITYLRESEPEDPSGVANVTPDDLISVYSQEGILLLDNVAADRIKSLPAGLYIVNGVKRIIK